MQMYKACWIESDNPQMLTEFKEEIQRMAKDKLGRDVFMADSQLLP